MRRAVITGLGVVSCLGNSKQEVAESLRAGRSGIRFNESFRDMGLRSQVSGHVDIDIKEHIDRKVLRFMGDAAAYAYIAMQQAVDDSGLDDDEISNPRTGLIAGSGGASSANIVASADILREKGVRRIGPYMVPRTMGSTVSACLATPFRIKGVNMSLTSACATSAHCIGAAWEQIQLGKQDVIFAGGGEENHWSLASLFDAMGALSTKYNETPERASRTYDQNRDGFVIAGGAGMVVVEELEHARARGARIYAEIVRRYHGHDIGIMQVDDLYTVEWAFIPHFYYNYYVYQYATSFTASTALAQKVIDGEPCAVENVIKFLSAGGSKYPIDVLKDAGIDMTTSDPFEQTMKTMEKVMDAIEGILDNK